MPNFKVKLIETVTYTLIVTAADAETAAADAVDQWNHNENPSAAYETFGNGVEVLSTDKVENAH